MENYIMNVEMNVNIKKKELKKGTMNIMSQ